MRTKSDYFKLALWFFPATVVTWGLHEFGHYATGLLLGYDMFITFNHAGPTQGSYTSTNHDILVGMAGPIITWVQAVIAWRMIMKRDQIELYAFLFLPFAMRTMAMGLSYIAKPNDEAAASLLLGLPMWVLPVQGLPATALAIHALYCRKIVVRRQALCG